MQNHNTISQSQQKLEFIKMNGAGNDFIIVDFRKNPCTLTKNQIIFLSKRNIIGCDQFIVLKESQDADIFMEIYNCDGSISQACGNATRCVASLIMQESGTKEIKIATRAGILHCQKDADLIQVNMGQPKFANSQIPLIANINSDKLIIEDLQFSAVNMGNPHIVTFIKDPLSDVEFIRIGSKCEKHHYFPEKTNVEFVQKIGPNHLKVRVFERGAGETLSCGSGACAVGVVALKKGICQGEVKVSFKGGDLFIKLNEKGQVIMSGNTQEIFRGLISHDFLENFPKSQDQ